MIIADLENDDCQIIVWHQNGNLNCFVRWSAAYDKRVRQRLIGTTPTLEAQPDGMHEARFALASTDLMAIEAKFRRLFGNLFELTPTSWSYGQEHFSFEVTSPEDHRLVTIIGNGLSRGYPDVERYIERLKESSLCQLEAVSDGRLCSINVILTEDAAADLPTTLAALYELFHLP